MNTSTPSSGAAYNLVDEVNRTSSYILPILMAFTLIGNLINIAVLSRRALRLSPCSHYFLGLAFASFIYMSVSPTSIFFYYRLGILLSNSPITCRIISFAIYSSALFIALMLVCASLDRFFASSSSVHLRNLSDVRIARRLIILSSIFTITYMSPFFAIYYWDYTLNRCIQSSSAAIIVYFSSRVILYYVLAPLTMALFGLLTIRNIREQMGRVAPVNQTNSRRRRRTEGQLARMLIIQVTAYVFFSLPAAVTYVLTTFVPAMNTSFITGIRSITIVWQQGTYVLSTFLYILSANIYREELKKIFRLNHYYGQLLQRATRHLRTYIETNT